MEKSKPLVSIVIPVYKVEKYLRASIDSAIHQTYKNIEIILVDDGSPDNCPRICDEYGTEHDNVKVIHKVNGGLSDARNRGIAESNGDYIYFLDSDDTIMENAVEVVVKLALDNCADIVIPDRYYKVFEDSDKKTIVYHFDKTGYIEDPVQFALDVIIGKGRAWRAHSVLYNAELIKQNNCEFPVGYTSEDIVFNLNAMLYAKKISFCDVPIEIYLKRKSSITGSFNAGFFKTILFIDDRVSDFIDKADAEWESADNKRKSLLNRNTIAYLFKVFSKNGLSKKQKSEIYTEIINNDRIQAALKCNFEAPYFNNHMVSVMFVMIYKLLSNKQYALAKFVISLTSRMR